MWNSIPNNKPLPHFSGRMKTVKERVVTFDKEGFDDDCESIFNSGSVLAPVGLIGSLFGFPQVSTIGVVPSLFLPSAYSSRRKISYKDVSVPMTLKEELAAMTPLEKAHFQIQQALDNWSKVRQEQKNTVQKLANDLGSAEQDLQALEKEVCPKGDDPAEFQSRLKMRLKARESGVQQQKTLLETAQKVFTTLDAEIQKREQNLFEAQEKLNMMQRQKSVIDLHQQLVKIKGGSGDGVVDSGMKENDSEQFALEMKRQQVEIEALMASLQTEMDVEAVLKSASEMKN